MHMEFSRAALQLTESIKKVCVYENLIVETKYYRYLEAR